MKNLLQRTLTCCGKEKRVSLFKIWLNLHLTNEYFKHKETNCFWKISRKHKRIFLLCFLCYAALQIGLFLLNTEYIYSHISLPGSNLFYIFINLLIILLPLSIVDFLIIKFIPLECKEE